MVNLQTPGTSTQPSKTHWIRKSLLFHRSVCPLERALVIQMCRSQTGTTFPWFYLGVVIALWLDIIRGLSTLGECASFLLTDAVLVACIGVHENMHSCWSRQFFHFGSWPSVLDVPPTPAAGTHALTPRRGQLVSRCFWARSTQGFHW